MHSSIRIAVEFLELARKQTHYKEITTMQLLKLVYIAHGWMLGLYDKPLISDEVEAWQYGPVIPNLYKEIKSYGGGPVESINLGEKTDLNEQEKETLQQVFDEYSGLSGFSLSAITHTKRTPWYEVWHENKYNLKIPNHLIKNYYKELANSA